MNGSSRKRALRRAIIGSFAIYLLPILGPHSLTFSGAMLLEEIFRGHGREFLWRALDIGLALTLQALFAALLYLLFSGRHWWRWLLLLPALPAFFFVQLFGYLVAIPTLFLVEADPAPEQGDWPRACELQGQWFDGTGAAADLAMERAGEMWLLSADAAPHYSILSMPGCRLRPIDLPVIGSGNGLGQVRPGGAAIYQIFGKSNQKTDVNVLPAGASEAIHPTLPNGRNYWEPIFAGDQSEVAWLDHLQNENGVAPIIRLRLLTDGTERTIPLPHDGCECGQYKLLAYDDRSGDLLLSFYPNGMLGVALDGTVRWGPFTADGLASIGGNVRRVGEGWIAWDSYRDQGRYRIAWSLPSGSGWREIPKGRSITSLSVNPAGDLVAVSTSPSVSLGDIPDSLFVFKAADGGEVYRRILPTYSRSNVQFIGNDYLAMYEFAGEESRVVVLQVMR